MEYITVKEYAKKYGITPATVRQRILRGSTKAIKVGNEWLLLANEKHIDGRQSRKMRISYKAISEKGMSNGQRNLTSKPLTEEEIEFVKKEIRRIGADESKFIFNDPKHIPKSTCYNYEKDIVFVTKNVLPDLRYGSSHPRDLMSVAALLAHEYYGYRHYRQEYLDDDKKGNNYHTTLPWRDECRASITAAKLTPNLTEKERADLVSEALRRAEDEGQYIELDDFMKETLYGYSNKERNISWDITEIHYVSRQNGNRDDTEWGDIDDVSKMREEAEDLDDLER